MLLDTIELNTDHSYTRKQRRLFSRDSIILLHEIEQMVKNGERFRQSKRTYEQNKSEQRSIDSANVLRLIQITKKYGFPTLYRIKPKYYGDFTAHLIFVHAPPMFKESLKPLVESEYNSGRISEYEYTHIMWHLNGRIGYPKYKTQRRPKASRIRRKTHRR